MALDYPISLPCPQTLLATPFDRGQYSDKDRPREVRALSTDRLAVVRATWPPLSPAEAAVLHAFWKDDLLDGGAWFNATWPLPQGKVPAVFRFIQQPRWRFVPGGRWRVEAVMEQRGRTVPVLPAIPPSAELLAWFEPIDSVSGSLDHENSGSGPLYGPGAVTALVAGVIGWSGQTIVWSIASWVSGDGDAAPFIIDSADGWVQIQWNNKAGWDPDFPFTYDASIGTLILTASIDGVPVATGHRLMAVSTPPTIDYPDVAWAPE